MKKLIICVMTVVALSACANTKEKKSALTAEQKQQILKKIGYKCEKVAITGSQMPRKRCTTEAQRAEIAKRDQDMLRRATRGSSGTGG